MSQPHAARSSARERAPRRAAAGRAKRRQPEERLAESLHATAFLIDGHEQRRLTNRVHAPRRARVSCSTLSKLRVNRITPPTSGDPSHSRSSAAIAVPRKSIIKGPSDTSSQLGVTRSRTTVPASTSSNSSTTSLSPSACSRSSLARRAASYPACRGCRCSGALCRLAEPVSADFRAREPQDPRQDPVAVGVGAASAAE